MLLKPGERWDDLQIKGYQIIQNPELFCFGIDAVLLSSFARVEEGEKALDLGTGTGIIPILLKAKTKGLDFTGLEIQPSCVDMAKRSVEYNQIEDSVHITAGDIKEVSSIFPAASFQVVTSNPPYMNDLHGIKNPSEPKAIARHEVLCTLKDVIMGASKMLKPGGRFYMIHRPHRLPEIMSVMQEYKIEPKRMRMVHSYLDKEPSMVLIEGSRGGKPFLKVEAPLIIYKENQIYTDEVCEMYGMKRR